MNRTMFRYWRIAFSVICLALLAMTVFMWLRSYSWHDAYRWRSPNLWEVSSIVGHVHFIRAVVPPGWPSSNSGWNSATHRITEEMTQDYIRLLDCSLAFLGVHVGSGINSEEIVVPYWMPTALLGAIAGLPWYWKYLRFKFSLREVLLMLTTFAVVLGYIVWQVHQKRL